MKRIFLVARYLFIGILLVTVTGLDAQSDPCSLSAVISSYEAAALSGDVQTWAQGYLERGCSEQINQGIRTLAEAYAQMTQTDITLSDGRVVNALNGEIHMLGQPWEEDGVSLNLVRLDVRSSGGEPAAVQAWFRFFNYSGQRLLVDVDWNEIYIEDNAGTRYVDWDGGGNASVWVESGSSYDFDRYYTVTPGERSRVPSDAEFMRVVVEQFSRLTDLHWHFAINPELNPILPPSPDETYAVTQSWESTDLSLTLNNLEVRSTAGEPAAVRAWFTITNQSNSRRLIEVDFSRIFILDGFGRRFIDWDGGGFISIWLDPGQSYEFNRYYSEMAGVQSRVTRGSEFVLVIAQGVAEIDHAQWQFDIVR
jgi:hypothetical protein